MAEDICADSDREPKKRRSDKECRHYHRDWSASLLGPLWCMGWLFTLGFLKLPFFWKGLLALIVWPYYLGRYFAP